MTMANFDKALLPAVGSEKRLCKAMGVRLVTNPVVVQFAKNAGFDALFIDLEHSSLSLADVGAISNTALLTGVTPFVRVPYQCGMGYIQQLLDGGAMGIIFPHINSAKDARAAVQMCKFPPQGKRSVWAQQPALGLRLVPLRQMIQVCNETSSSVHVMVETVNSVENVESIAAVEGVDVLIVGCLDLSTDMGIPGDFENPRFREALANVSVACQRLGKCIGLAGIYNRPAFQGWAIHTLKVRFMLCQHDSNILALGAEAVAADITRIERSNGTI